MDNKKEILEWLTKLKFGFFSEKLGGESGYEEFEEWKKQQEYYLDRALNLLQK